MYESPIKIIEDISREVTDAFEAHVYQCVLRYGVEVDKEELVKALSYDRHMYEKGYEDGFADGKRFAQNASRPKGEWIVTQDGMLACSNCLENPTNRIIINGNLVYDMTPIRKMMRFCPKCGSYNGGENEKNNN